MKASTIGSVLITAATWLAASPAHAQLNRTAVSGKGSDANNCAPATPCRTFARAISQTNPSGEIIVLDSAGYGPFSINKSITVQAAPGIYAGISAPTGHAIDLATGPNIVVLRGLTLQGGGVANNFGIYGFASIVHVENCVIDGFDTGIGDGAYTLTVSDSEIRNNKTAGIVVANAGANAVLERVRLKNNGNDGLIVQDHAKATVRNSVSSGQSGGFSAVFFAVLNVENSVATRNLGNVYSDSSATVRVSNTVVTDATTAGLWNTNVGTMLSWGNNKVAGNGPFPQFDDVTGTVGSLPLQ